MEAINKKHQAMVNKFMAWNAKYDILVNEDRDCTPRGEFVYDKALSAWESLPKREQKNLMAQDKSLIGSY